MYLCSDVINYGSEKDCTDYSLEGSVLRVHTLTLCKGEKPSHVMKEVEIPKEEAEKLRNMTEEERLKFILVHQAKWLV